MRKNNRLILLLVLVVMLSSCGKTAVTQKQLPDKGSLNQKQQESPQKQEVAERAILIKGTLAPENQESGKDDSLKGETQVVFYVVGSTGSEDETPTYYLKPMKIISPTEKMYYEDIIMSALNTLFSIKTIGIDENSQTALYKSNVKADKVVLEEGLMKIYLKGKIIPDETLHDFVKPEIDKTIQAYTTNYKVYLNDSETAWSCTFDKNACK